MKEGPLRIVVAQLGARRHYAVPEILERAGMLEAMYTDLYVLTSLKCILRGIPAALQTTWLKRLADRHGDAVPATKVTSFPLLGAEYAVRRRMAKPGNTLGVHLAAGHSLCRRALEAGLRDAAGVYTFNTAGLELLRGARQAGLKTISDQTIAPRRVEERLLRAEREKWPGWDRPGKADVSLAAYVEREEEEWVESELIVCGSEFVKRGIVECGGPADRCVVVPTGISPAGLAQAGRRRHKGALRVLTVGAVGLRKGSPYVWRAAAELRGLCVFRMVGEVEAPESVMNRAPGNVEVMGPVARSEVGVHYEWADVFLLPSVCEGSAIACDEARACGLPVVCTLNTGSVVTEGADGYVLGAGDVGGFVARLEGLARSEEAWRGMSRGAMEAAKGLSEQYGRRLVGAIGLLFG